MQPLNTRIAKGCLPCILFPLQVVTVHNTQSQCNVQSSDTSSKCHLNPFSAQRKSCRVELAARQASHTKASTSQATADAGESAAADGSTKDDSLHGSDLAWQVLMFYRALGHLTSCASDLRWGIQGGSLTDTCLLNSMDYNLMLLSLNIPSTAPTAFVRVVLT